MVYTELTKIAMNIAYKAHDGQLDKGGIPYIYHPFHLAEQCDDEKTCATALLHDVIEDCPAYSFDKLIQAGITMEVVEAVRLLTHDKAVAYMDYIKEIKCNQIARKVKILDLNHNLDESRLLLIKNDEILKKVQRKRAIYREALDYLSQPE